jgi:hypothetical protein
VGSFEPILEGEKRGTGLDEHTLEHDVAVADSQRAGAKGLHSMLTVLLSIVRLCSLLRQGNLVAVALSMPEDVGNLC